MSDSFSTPGTVAHQAPLPMGFPRHNNGVDCHFLLQGISPTQGSNLSLLHWHADPLPLRRLGIPQLRLLLFSHQAVSNSLRPHGPQHTRLPCPSPSPGVCPSACPLNQWCHPTISFSITLFSFCLQSFPALKYPITIRILIYFFKKEEEDFSWSKEMPYIT